MTCKLCGSEEAIKDSFTRYGHKIGPYCISCWNKLKLCEHCGKIDVFQEDARKKGVSYYSDVNECLCSECRSTLKGNIKTCTSCGYKHSSFIEGEEVCTRCKNQDYFYCESCKSWHLHEENFFSSVSNQTLYYHVFIKNTGGICTKCSKTLCTKVDVTVHKCSHCDSLQAINWYKDDSGNKKYVCNYCASTLFKCDDCGEIHKDARYDIRLYTEEGNISKQLCYQCYRSYEYCEYCNRYEKEGSMHKTSEGRSICSKCIKVYSICERCGVYRHNDKLKLIKGKYYCSTCAKQVAVCTECNELTEYAVPDTGICRKCYAIKYGTGTVQSHNFKPKFHTHTIGNDKLLFGIENEISIKNGVDRAIGFIHKHWKEDEVYCVHDGSVANGFEVVTHPRNFSSIKSTDWSNLFPTTAIKHRSCGMHVHMTRECFTKFHLFKFISFINDKPNFIRMIGQRMTTRYCSKNTDKISHAVKCKTTSTRYARVNLQNKATIECRFFANVVTSEGLLKNIEFLKALYEFTLLNKPKDCTVSNFISYVSSNRRKFNNLAAFLINYKILKVKSKGVA